MAEFEDIVTKRTQAEQKLMRLRSTVEKDSRTGSVRNAASSQKSRSDAGYGPGTGRTYSMNNNSSDNK